MHQRVMTLSVAHVWSYVRPVTNQFISGRFERDHTKKGCPLLMLNILFMCVANSARSQMAEGLAREIFGRDAGIQSAGSLPKSLSPFAVSAMKEVGIDISRQWSKSPDDLSPGFIEKLDYVITLCVEEVCPTMVSRAKKIHWPLRDPAAASGSDAEKLKLFRETRDELQSRIVELKKSL